VQYEYWNDEKNQAAGKTLLRIILTELDFLFLLKAISFSGIAQTAKFSCPTSRGMQRRTDPHG